MKLINIGFGNMVSANRMVAVVGSDSAPIKRIVGEAKSKSLLIDATFGRKCKSVLLMDSSHVVLSALSPETIGNRMEAGEQKVE